MSDPSTIASIRRRLDHLDRNPTLLQPQDALALRALEARITSMRAHSNVAQSSLPAELDQLLVRTQRLSRKAAQQQQSYDSSDDDDDEVATGLTAASISRQLQESIASHHIATIMLPPTRKLVVNEDPPAGMDDASQEKRRLALEQHDEDIAEYEQGAAALRKRQGYASKEGDDGGRAGSEKSPSYAEKEKPSTSSSTSTQQPLLSTERTTQEALSTELLRMASILRSQTVSFSSALERDRKLLESADEKLVQNMDVMTRTRGKLGEYAHTARGMGWFTLGTVLMVVMTWVVMFVVIKLT